MFFKQISFYTFSSGVVAYIMKQIQLIFLNIYPSPFIYAVQISINQTMKV